MAAHGKLAASYAKGIFDYLGGGKSGAKARSVADELESFAEILGAHQELERLFTTAVFTDEKRREVLEDLAKKLKVSDEARRILLVLAAQGRIAILGDVADRVRRLLQDAEAVVPMYVESSVALEAAEKKKLEQKFKTLLGKTVEASYAVDPGLIGGLKVTAGGKTYDGSLAGQLRAIEERLVGGQS